MGLDISKMLTPSKAPFYGIVPGNAVTPLGSVVLPVTFGTKDNYHTEYTKFKVADFDSSYHAILGKIGVLTLRVNLKKLYDFDQEVIEYAATSRVQEPSAEVLAVALKLTNTAMEISI
ncbi:uncharacterized protein LOC112896198 [Panicum hallii]|uniref:uncharacterized protein LOC112896198 n=1 Tax=Panicum hallii TaxID=206008 RepID=UPI000DF4CC81|nr:uncharacterized protein LOC112896198 [Panicum hallii]